MDRFLFVPLEEFLQNGGTLTAGRTLYIEPSSQGTTGVAVVGELVEHQPDNGLCVMKSGWGQFPMIDALLFVKVPAIPQYV
jgi:hypothetical protein